MEKDQFSGDSRERDKVWRLGQSKGRPNQYIAPVNMEAPRAPENQYIWQDWARFLHRWGVGDVVAAFLEAAGPLLVLAAQMIYIGQPLLNIVFSDDTLDTMAGILEDSTNTKAFAIMLRETPEQ